MIILACMGSFAAEKPIPIIFDTDIGTDVDDAYALVLAARSPQLELKAVTTLYGKVEVRSAIARKLLLLMGKDSVPVASGPSKAIAGHDSFWGGWEGKGLLATNEEVHGVSSKPARDVMIETILASDRKVTIVSVGGLSNVAAALETMPSLRARIERLIIMGGCVRPLLIQGKPIPPRRETNLRNDVDAAEIVFKSGVPITLAPAEVTFRTKLFFRDFELIEKSSSRLAQAITALTSEWESRLRGFMKSFGVEAYYTDGSVMLHDPLAVCLLVDPTVATVEPLRIRIELGKHPDGKREIRIIADPDGPVSIDLVTDVDLAKLSRIATDAVVR